MNRIALILLPLLVALAPPVFGAGPALTYAIARVPTPVFNVPDIAAVFGDGDGQTIRSDSCGQLRTLEFIALPGTSFRVYEQIVRGSETVYRVATDDYPYPTKTGYFIDSRFVTATPDQPLPRPRTLPPRDVIISRLVSAQGSRYVWGSNVREGVPQMLTFFPPRDAGAVSKRNLARWQLRGLDCSGLLYDATGGFTPRNTSALVVYGNGVPIAGLRAAEIVRRLEPLDLIVWNGHVMIVLDRERLIESRLDCSGKNDGVRIRPLRAALEELLKSRVPQNEYDQRPDVKGFVVRRWYDAAGRKATVTTGAPHAVSAPRRPVPSGDS